MVDGADDMIDSLKHLSERGGPVFKMKNDPRVTQVGKFLRASKGLKLAVNYDCQPGKWVIEYTHETFIIPCIRRAYKIFFGHDSQEPDQAGCNQP